ncbi:MAG TPA: hypothetical protein VFQ44_28870 [Streptosporangiaceae bacterium]|nr:hypothetical protein [Streptosporangiaceae bacterium]
MLEGGQGEGGWMAVRPDEPRISELFRVPDRYLRSAHLERDFEDVASLRDYIVTPAIASTFGRVLEGLRPGSGLRAWRVTGDYGTGKSSFALALAHLLRDPDSAPLAGMLQAIGPKPADAGAFLESGRLTPVLVTGTSAPLAPSIGRAIGVALDRLRPRGRLGKDLEQLRDRAASLAGGGDAGQLLELLDAVSDYAVRRGSSGLLLVLDELGKFLEYASLHPERDDVYVLQRLAEAAARSGDRPLIIMGLLHQGFDAYAEPLPTAARLEWEKVAGRFDEITFDQPLAHVAALVAGALNVDHDLMPAEIAEWARTVSLAAAAAGWHGVPAEGSAVLDLYPIHPTVLPVLVQFFARFGQHERSLFSFLLSPEPFGLQAFADRRATARNWYRLPDFYDYVRAVFGHRLAGASYSSQWLRMTGTIDRAVAASDLDGSEVRVLKAVALLNVLDAEHLTATDIALSAALLDQESPGELRRTATALKRRGLLFDRGAAGGYCLWPNTSVNLEAAFGLARRTLGPADQIAAQLAPYLDESPVVARRHYITTGTLRHFALRHAEPTALHEAVSQPCEADGLIVIALCQTQQQRELALSLAADPAFASREDVVLAIPSPLQGVAGPLQDARCWQWVAENIPELGHDTYAAAEVSRQVALSRRALARRLSALFGIRIANPDVEWWRSGSRLVMPRHGGLSALLSGICDELYPQAPQILNELLNRQYLSSAAAAARQRLTERIFSAADQRCLGIPDGKSPPEKSMYLSVLEAGNVHRFEGTGLILTLPPEQDDPLRLRPALAQVITALEAMDGRRVPVPEIFATLQARPFGIRAGLAPLLLAIVAAAHSHEIAVYETGTFLPSIRGADFQRLIKQPALFEFQLCRVTGVRAEVFARLAQVFADQPPGVRQPDLLDVVRPLTALAAGLPDYARQTGEISDLARSVRQVLLTAREPSNMLFRDLPVACGLQPFPQDGAADTRHAQDFVARMREATDELRAAYPRLLERIREHLAGCLAGSTTPSDRPEMARRAARAVLAAREPRLAAFARSIADTALGDDAWAERIGSLVMSKPPSHWNATDYRGAWDEIELLSGAFCRLETTAFSNGSSAPDLTAVRIAVTAADGNETARVVRLGANDEEAVGTLVERLEAALGEADRRELRLVAIARLLTASIPQEPSIG